MEHKQTTKHIGYKEGFSGRIENNLPLTLLYISDLNVKICNNISILAKVFKKNAVIEIVGYKCTQEYKI